MRSDEFRQPPRSKAGSKVNCDLVVQRFTDKAPWSL